jgi:hypothetical protein
MYNAICCRLTKLKHLRECGAVASTLTLAVIFPTRVLGLPVAAVLHVAADPENATDGPKGSDEHA